MPASLDDEARLAADPTTDPTMLHQLAQRSAELWPLIVANPAASPELRDWIHAQAISAATAAAADADPVADPADADVVSPVDIDLSWAPTAEAAGSPYMVMPAPQPHEAGPVPPPAPIPVRSSYPAIEPQPAGGRGQGSAWSGMRIALVAVLAVVVAVGGGFAGALLRGGDDTRASSPSGQPSASATTVPSVMGTEASPGAAAGDNAALPTATATTATGLTALSNSSCATASTDASVLVSYGASNSRGATWTTADGENSVILAMADLQSSCGHDYARQVAQTATASGATPALTTTLSSYTRTEASPAPAGSFTYQYIDTPSKNISCELHEDYVACSILLRDYSAAGQSDCSSSHFSISVGQGSSQLRCGEQFLGVPGMTFHELQYEQSTTFSNFACTARLTGMTCWNTVTGRGFTISSESYTQF
ncbi:hypothetical protein [Actinomyces oricola]|uniref:variant leucine-rich repeat-containing protein n=1 Tax=Actinomyces oricola TaxID=206043 RepID=UPI000FFE456C|nr:hypothetical protein [Actinomyces oricola]